MTAVMITCSYHQQEFVRVGYFVHNDYESAELRETPPENPDMSQKISRNIMVSSDWRKGNSDLIYSVKAEEPRVTRFRINWGDGPAVEAPPVEEEERREDGAVCLVDDHKAVGLINIICQSFQKQVLTQRGETSQGDRS